MLPASPLLEQAESELHGMAGAPSAYGVVCGNISRLIVLDFDDADVQAEFMQQYSHLLETYLVRSGLRGTLHIYLHVDFEVKSCRLRGGDLKAEGGYVVGAGSEIADGKWELVQDKPLYLISEAELNQILADFALPKESLHSNGKLFQNAKSPNDFRNIYVFLVKEYGKRNEALFRVGCLLRDSAYNSLSEDELDSSSLRAKLCCNNAFLHFG